ncbi:hypothetical protein BX070DRAFT_226607 [Coemansia spiralis]|nr:hypothetical protein BX070DRAFT_226607 [Coemansia spiralis]
MNIQINENYNPTTFANNIAVLTINNPDGESFNNPIGNWPPEWGYYYFIEDSPYNDLSFWNTINAKGADPATDYTPCTDSSSLFRENMAALIYNSLTSISTTNTKCNSPYEYVIGSSTSNSVVIALYSYSTVSAKADNSFCSTSVQIQDFYTNPFNFIPWDEEKTGARILRKHTDTTTYNKTTNIHFAMIIPDSNTKEQWCKHLRILWRQKAP